MNNKRTEQNETGQFDDIRPYYDSEVRDALDRLVRDPSLTGFMAGWLAPGFYRVMPPLMRRLVSTYLKREMRGVTDIRSFQDVVAKYARKLVAEGTAEFRYEGFDQLKQGQAYLFISNHRDIAGDSMLLDYALYLNGLDTVRIAIGDNLVQVPFATSIMRLNKGFFIKRSASGPRKTYAALMQSSLYIKHSLETGQSIWIAQSEGRSKDGLDLTDPAIIKMFLLSRRKEPIEDALEKLNIIPLSISYEFDPCDLVKAREQYVVASEGEYRKTAGEDLLSLVRGLSGQKGRVILRLGEQIRAEHVREASGEEGEGEGEEKSLSAEGIAAAIDRQIVSKMELFPINYWAVTQLHQEPWAGLHGEAEAALQRLLNGASFKPPGYFANCPKEHLPYLLGTYANPVVNRHNQIYRV